MMKIMIIDSDFSKSTSNILGNHPPVTDCNKWWMMRMQHRQWFSWFGMVCPQELATLSARCSRSVNNWVNNTHNNDDNDENDTDNTHNNDNGNGTD